MNKINDWLSLSRVIALLVLVGLLVLALMDKLTAGYLAIGLAALAFCVLLP